MIKQFPHLKPFTTFNEVEADVYFCSVMNLVIIYLEETILVSKSAKHNRAGYINLFSKYSNLLVVFDGDKKTHTPKKLSSLRSVGIRCTRVDEYQTGLHEYIKTNYPIDLPRLTIPNSAWIGDKGSNVEKVFFNQCPSATPCGDRYSRKFNHLNHIFNAHSDAYNRVTGDIIEIKSRGLNTIDTYAECERQLKAFNAKHNHRWQHYQALWYSWSHNYFKHKAIAQSIGSRYIILYPDNAFINGDVSVKDIERMESANMRYNSFKQYNLEVNQRIKERMLNAMDYLPNHLSTLQTRETPSQEEAIVLATRCEK